MMLRNVTSRTIKPYPAGDGVHPTGVFTLFTLDCGHTTRRNGEQLSLQRLLCGTCAAAVADKTASAMR